MLAGKEPFATAAATGRARSIQGVTARDTQSLGNRNLSFLVPVHEFLGPAQGAAWGRFGLEGYFRSHWDCYPCLAILYNFTLPPPFLPLRLRAAKVQLLVHDSL